MRLEIEVEMNATLAPDDAALLMIEVANRDGQRVVTSKLSAADATLTRPGTASMVWAMVPASTLSLTYRATVEVFRGSVALDTLNAAPLPLLPADVLPYLRPSRYCQADLFTDFVAQNFGPLKGGMKVRAIRDWITEHVAYAPGTSDATTTAVETFAALQGVCRDFAHLMCALTRAAGIPARYVSVYGAEVTPQDFHAIAEVWLDGAWVLVDATDMGAAHQMAVIATGRDAADTAFMETAQWASLTSQSVRVHRR